MRKLPLGQQIHTWESKHDERCCSCLADCETDDHVLQCQQRVHYQNRIYQVIKHLGKETDPVLLDILLDGATKYLKGTRQMKYIVSSNSSKQQTNYYNRIRKAIGQQERATEGKEHDYLQLKRNQEVIGLDNLLRGKFAKDWRKLSCVHNRKLKAIQRQKEKLQREQEKKLERHKRRSGMYIGTQ